jgi:hypothetical protein
MPDQHVFGWLLLFVVACLLLSDSTGRAACAFVERVLP